MEVSSNSEKGNTLIRAKNVISQSLGDISDLNYELINTIANIYFKQLDEEPISEDIPFIESIIPDLIALKEKDVKAYEILTMVLLCKLKYRMATNPMNKTVTRLKIEMKLRKGKVNEIPDLAELMGLI